MLPLSKYSTFFIEDNSSTSLKYYSYYFDETDGELLYYTKSNRLGFFLTERTNLYAKIKEGILKDTKDVYAIMKEVAALNEISKPIDFFDDFLGPLIRIVFTEMFDGNEIDRRIVAESVINRWDRKDFHSFLINGKEAKNFKEIIEKPSAYKAILAAQGEDEGSYNRYKDFVEYLNWMFDNKHKTFIFPLFHNPLVGVIKVCIQTYCRSHSPIGQKVTHYVSSPSLPSHYDDMKPEESAKYEKLISPSLATNAIIGNNKVLAAAKEI